MQLSEIAVRILSEVPPSPIPFLCSVLFYVVVQPVHSSHQEAVAYSLHLATLHFTYALILWCEALCVANLECLSCVGDPPSTPMPCRDNHCQLPAGPSVWVPVSPTAEQVCVSKTLLRGDSF